MAKKIISVLLIFIMVFSPCCIFASSVSTLKKEQDELEKKQDEVENEKSEQQKKVTELSNQIADNEDKLEEINAKLVSLNSEIKELKKELEETQKKYEKQETALKEKLILGYEMSSTTYLDFLLNSKGVIDFLSNYYLISEILQNDNDLLDSIEEQKNKIENDKKQVEEKKQEVKKQKAEQEKINVVLENQKIQKQKQISNLTAEEKALQEQIDEYDDLIREAEEKARKIASKSTGVYVGGNKVWPIPGHTNITSGFGSRNTGIKGASTNHKGIDVGAPVGTKIVSVLDGKVIFTGFNAARGYYIMVDHGGGVVTLYQHCKANSYTVSVGDTVKAGQTIVLSGNTGIGSGPHLHFEVLINGTNVNPATWLSQG